MATNRYEVWDKTSDVYTPSGEVFSAAQWIDRYAWIANPKAVPVVAGGMINGAYSGELSQMVDMYEKMGCDFSECTTHRDYLDTIEAFEDYMNTPPEPTDESSAEDRIAAALEYANLINSPTVNEDDPDVD